ncbi:MAG TPA: outer membrane lipoprotein-sorting protein [Spirochaetales bacterium]|nr:outer membrane lipoprotein-sorting protein [Spirochaetales bacterium]HRY54920.1 outer membrane lipoprotein-sorting protein [Spirochaetia bacterium]HRZ63507.1 outer membrane lipoprotein-sorting protein [Spirochaetia bacterium]
MEARKTFRGPRAAASLALAAAIAAWSWAAPAAAQAPAGRAEPRTAAEILAAVEAAERSETERSTYAMTVRDKAGSRSYRVRMLSRGSEESLIEFLEPRTVKGLRILSLDDETWAFFPSTGRTRKISGASRSGSVQGVGGDFSYDDLGSGTWSKDYAFAIESESASSWVLAGRSLKPDGSYDRVRMTVDRALLRETSVDFSTPKDGFFKTLSFSGHKSFGGRLMPSRMEMRNPAKGTSTILELEEAVFDEPIDPRWFSPERFSK